MAICPFADQSRRYDATWPMSYTSGPWKGLLHTTESTTLPSYADEKGRAGARAPHFTGLADPATRTVKVWQHFDTARPSRALANTSAPGETNREQVVQIELVGTSGWVFTVAPNSTAMFWPEAPDWAIAGVARLMRWVEQAHGIPSVSTARPWTAWNARPSRMTPAEWDQFTGWCGHQHVPENDHTDPGALAISRLLATVTQEDDDMPLSDADVDRVAAAVWKRILPAVTVGSGSIGPATAETYLTHTRALAVDPKALAAEVAAALAEGTTLTVTATAPASPQ